MVNNLLSIHRGIIVISLERNSANALSISRIVAGPTVAGNLLETPPEERTVRSGIATALVSATDFVDGYLGRRAGSSEFGTWADQIADKLFVSAGQLALAHNGEITKTHPALKIARDISVNALRIYAQRSGEGAPVSKLGKQKTFVEMATLSAVNSPLAKDPDIARRGFSVATALSLVSGVEYALDYFKKDVPENDQEVSTRNSKAREVASGPMGKIVDFIDEKARFVQPDHLTIAGAGMVIGAGIMALRNPNRTAIPTTIYAIGSLIDGLDGNLARKKAEQNGCTTSTKGMLADLWADKVQEVFTMCILSKIARERGNNVSADNYAVGAMTTSLSALTRALAESRGLIVNEGGVGTRVTRGIMGGVGMGLNRAQDASDIISATIASGNVITTSERVNVAVLGEKSPYVRGKDNSDKFKNSGKVKVKSLIALSTAGVIAGGLLLRRK